jgi:hypothetical protein
LTGILSRGPELLSQKKVQLALLARIEHPDSRWVPYDYEECWKLRHQREEPRCEWWNMIQKPTEMLGQALGIEVTHVGTREVAPAEVRRIIAESRNKLGLEQK